MILKKTQIGGQNTMRQLVTWQSLGITQKKGMTKSRLVSGEFNTSMIFVFHFLRDEFTYLSLNVATINRTAINIQSLHNKVGDSNSKVYFVLQIYPSELEECELFERFEDFVQTFTIRRGKNRTRENTDEQIVGEFKVRGCKVFEQQGLDNAIQCYDCPYNVCFAYNTANLKTALENYSLKH